MTNAVNALRKVLRTLNRNLNRSKHADTWKSYVMDQFRNEGQLKNIKVAHDYAFLVNAVECHRDLLFSYNISVSKDHLQRQSVESVASRVGLRVPQNYHDSKNPEQ
mmetsp:Transcript_22500/g.31309  ORF Transcript_22500/g.31309 Transcript_22500/m.31309 type:complete len:106 (-) Transcript_22500:281-598(-)